MVTLRQSTRGLGKERIGSSKVVLSGLKAGSLDDYHGMRWDRGLLLQLDGFEYERFESTEVSASKEFRSADYLTEVRARLEAIRGKAIRKLAQRTSLVFKIIRDYIAYRRHPPVWKHRIMWLQMQYPTRVSRPTEYRSQPYEQVAKTLRSQGDSEGATRVLVEKLRVERKIRFSRLHWKRVFLWGLDRFFGYGMLWKPVAFTFLFFWIIGWGGVDLANNGHLHWPPVGSRGVPVAPFLTIPRPVLVVDAAAVSTLAVTQSSPQPNPVVATEPATLSPEGGFVRETRCGEQIEPALYALDVFVPLLDLREESKCTISSESDAWTWRMAKTLYAIIGWIVTSALILTLSGLVQRQIER